jgi:hypothetical protein
MNSPRWQGNLLFISTSTEFDRFCRRLVKEQNTFGRWSIYGYSSYRALDLTDGRQILHCHPGGNLSGFHFDCFYIGWSVVESKLFTRQWWDENVRPQFFGRLPIGVSLDVAEEEEE